MHGLWSTVVAAKFSYATKLSRKAKTAANFVVCIAAFMTVCYTSELYNVFRPLSRDVLFCFLLKVLVTHWTAHVNNVRQNIATEGTKHSVLACLRGGQNGPSKNFAILGANRKLSDTNALHIFPKI